MRWLVIVLALAVSFPCAAQNQILRGLKNTIQKNAFKRNTLKNSNKVLRKAQYEAIKKTLGPNVNPQVLRSARIVQGKILLGGKHPNSKLNEKLDRYIFKQVATSQVGEIPVLLYQPTPSEWGKAVMAYLRIMEDFKTFKQEMDGFLYYQSKPSERRQLAASERSYWLGKISDMNVRLRSLRNLISPDDPAYKAAREYVAYAAETVDPTLRGMMGNYQDAVRKDRKFNESEFFLETPQANKEFALKGLLPLSMRAPQLAGTLPKGLKLAILNDRWSVLDKMHINHKKGMFFPDWELSYFKNTEDLLNAMRQGQHFDVILTDIIVPGGGGYYLTRSLRDQKYNGVIIALSAYEESASLGERMFSCGFDGMISLPVGFESISRSWTYEIMKKMQNYFYYRDANGWSR